MQNANGSGAMARALVAEAREILLLMSMLAGLSVMSLAVACGAVIMVQFVRFAQKVEPFSK